MPAHSSGFAVSRSSTPVGPETRLTCIEATQDQPEVLASEAGALEELHSDLTTSLSRTFAKLQKRCQEVDPITQKTLYGDAMKARVAEAFSRYSSLLQRVVELKNGPMEKACHDAENVRLAAESQARLAREEAAAARERQQEEAAQAQAAAKAAETRRLEMEANQRALLHREAALAREKKKKERDEREQAADHAWAEARAEDAALVDSILPGARGAEEALINLRHACGGEATKAYKEAVATLALYVGNIIAHPEEAAFKRISLEGAHFKSKLGPWGPCSLHCLVAAGFQVQREEEDEGGKGGQGEDSRTADGAGQEGSSLREDGGSGVEGKEGEIVLPGARVLLMIEPDMMRHQEEWTVWYDTCKGVRDLLQQEEARVKRL